MIEKKIEILIIRYCTNQLAVGDLEVLNEWLEEDVNKIAFEEYVILNYSIEKAKQYNDLDKHKMWSSIQNRIKPVQKRASYWKYAIAASVTLLLTVSVFFNTEKDDVIVIPDTIVVENNIEIGDDKAILTLGDGTSVALEKGKVFNGENIKSNGEELVYNDASSKQGNDTKNIAYNYLTVPRGGEFFVQLSDGTKVWLNSETKLKYPVEFAEGKPRKIELIYGEAYFDVSPSTEHKGTKFFVNTQLQEIEVLGTEFNIKAYKDENIIYTTLIEGKVDVNNGVNSAILKPGEQSSISKRLNEKEIDINIVDVYTVTSWKNGLFSFKDLKLSEIMKTLSRWYDVDVRFEKEELKDIHFKGVLSKNQNIEEILLIIKNTNFINAYDINDNIIILR